MKNKFFCTFAVTLAAVLCLTAFSTTAFAGGADPDPAPLPEETGTPTTGGIELDTEDAEGDNDTSSTTEDTENTDTEKSTGTAETMTDEEMAALLSSLLGSQVDVTVTDEGIQLTNKDDGTPNQTGTVVTNGGNLNVRTGAGTDNQAFTQLPNGTQVEVIGTEDNGWVKILLPEREGYVCGDYLTVSDVATGDGDFSLTLNGDELSTLLEQFGGSAGGSAALTPDGNLSLIDDIGTTGGKQFITLQTKAGNTFYLIIDRDDEGEETVHFLNQVDEADLMALTEDGETAPATWETVHFLNQVDEADLMALTEDGETAPATCTCTEKCEAGAVNTACPVCKDNLTACVGAAPEAEEPTETAEPEEEAENSMGGLIVFLVVLLIGGGAALYFFKFKKPKADTKGNDDLDEYDFGEDEDDDEDEPAPEDDTGEVEARPLDDYLLDEDEPKKEDEV